MLPTHVYNENTRIKGKINMIETQKKTDLKNIVTFRIDDNLRNDLNDMVQDYKNYNLNKGDVIRYILSDYFENKKASD